MEQNTNQTKKQSKWAWTITIIVAVLALLSAVIGIFGLIDGFNIHADKVIWVSIPAVVFGAVIAVLTWLTFSQQRVKDKTAWWIMQIVWTLCAIGLLVVGILGSIYINSKEGLVWLPICLSINGGLLLIDKVNYLINHFVRISKESKMA